MLYRLPVNVIDSIFSAVRHILSQARSTIEKSHREEGVIVNRRRFLYCLSSVTSAGQAAPRVAPLKRNHESSTRCSKRDAQAPLNGQPRVGVVGVVGVGVYFLDRVVQDLNFPCKTIAVETNMGRLRWCHAQDSILIDDHGPIPETFNDTRRMLHDWRSEFAKLVSSLDVAFILTGLNGTSGRGITSVVAETLGQLGVFTMAVLPGRREAEAVRSLGRQVDGVFEIPYEPFWDQARTPQGWQNLLAAEVAKVLRSASFSLARGSFERTDVEKTLPMMKAAPHNSTVENAYNDSVCGGHHVPDRKEP